MTDRVFSVALTDELHQRLSCHLLRDDGQEDLCFLLWHPSQGYNRTTAVLYEIILPQDGDRQIHGNASFMPQYLERAMMQARDAKAGLAFIHSHLGPGWQDMSSPDHRAEQTNAGRVMGATDLPFVGLTMGTDGALSARFWTKVAPRHYEPQWCTSARVIGERFRITYNDRLLPPPEPQDELRRTIAAWGMRSQADLSRLHVGIVGAGSVGSVIGEVLARMGVGHLTLIDFDTVEPVNMDRLLHADRWDAIFRRSKVHTLAQGLRRSSTAVQFLADEIEYSVAEIEGYKHALDCDILFSCVDRPWARSVLNFVAYAHLIPVVDGGVRVETSEAGFKDAYWRAHIAAPGRRCLSCLGQYNPADVSSERDGYFDDPRYIQGLPKDHPIRINENVFAFSVGAADFEVLQMLTMLLCPSGIANVGEQWYHLKTGTVEQGFSLCHSTCPYPALIAIADSANVTVTGRHLKAETTRNVRTTHKIKLSDRFTFFLKNLIVIFHQTFS